MISIGIIGAGTNSREKHIPLFQAIDGVEIVAICNRSVSSAQVVCDQFDISLATDNPDDLFDNDEIDAILIGTWPYKHCEYTLKALSSNKHVLTESRMAMNSTEAKKMLIMAKAYPHLITQIVPSPLTLQSDRIIKKLIETKIGELISVQVTTHQGNIPDSNSNKTWRQDSKLSGNNIMAIGIHYESIMRWLGPIKNIYAKSSIVISQVINPDSGENQQIDIPDMVNMMGTMELNNAPVSWRASAFCRLNGVNECWIYGTEGTIRVGFDGSVDFGANHDKALTSVNSKLSENPDWRVEEEFIGAIRGEETIKLTDFTTGLRYMQFMDAINQSDKTGKVVELESL